MIKAMKKTIKKLEPVRNKVKAIEERGWAARIGLRLLFACGIFVLLIAIVALILNLYTNHGAKVLVPDFKTLTMEEADGLASSHSFELQIVDSVYLPEKKKGTIVEQTPKPGSSVKDGRIIFITVNMTNAEKIKMPDLVNTSLRQAETMIQSYGLRLGRIKYQPDVAKDYVLAQLINGRNIKKGTLIERGTKIDLVLGLGQDDASETTVPQLVGLSYTEALAQIRSAGLKPGGVIYDAAIKTEDDSSAALIWKQFPESDESLVPAGSIIDIWLK